MPPYICDVHVKPDTTRIVAGDINTPAHAWNEDNQLSSGTDDNRRPFLQLDNCNDHIEYGHKYNNISIKLKIKRNRIFLSNLNVLEAINVPYFILIIVLLITLMHLIANEPMRQSLEYSPLHRGKQIWRLLTYTLLHVDSKHLILNVILAVTVGMVVEYEQGAVRTAVVWTGGAICGAVGVALLQPRVHLMGSSACVYAVLTSHLVNVSLRYGHIQLWWFRILSVMVIILSDGTLWSLVGVKLNGIWSLNNIAWSAHIFGAVGGILLGFIFYTGENADVIYNRLGRWSSLLILIIMITYIPSAIIVYNNV